MTTEGSVASNGPGPAMAYSNGTGSVELHLTISDPDLYAELSKRDEPERSEFAVASMKIGVIAFRQAQGQVDANQIRDAGERVIRDMRSINIALSSKWVAASRSILTLIADCLRKGFEDSSGKTTKRESLNESYEVK